MALTQRNQLTINQIAEFWSPEVARLTEQLRVAIEEAVWRGAVPRLRQHRRTWMQDIEWHNIPRPPGAPRTWSDADLEETCNAVAEHWPIDGFVSDFPTPIWLGDEVLTRAEFHQVIEALGEPWPKFWGPWEAEKDDVTPVDATAAGVVITAVAPHRAADSETALPPQSMARPATSRVHAFVKDQITAAHAAGRPVTEQRIIDAAAEAKLNASRDQLRAALRGLAPTRRGRPKKSR